jgi:hypothetical protein
VDSLNRAIRSGSKRHYSFSWIFLQEEALLCGLRSVRSTSVCEAPMRQRSSLSQSPRLWISLPPRGRKARTRSSYADARLGLATGVAASRRTTSITIGSGFAGATAEGAVRRSLSGRARTRHRLLRPLHRAETRNGRCHAATGRASGYVHGFGGSSLLFYSNRRSCVKLLHRPRRWTRSSTVWSGMESLAVSLRRHGDDELNTALLQCMVRRLTAREK